MKKTVIFAIFLATFVGTLTAIQFNHWWQNRGDLVSDATLFSRTPMTSNADYAPLSGPADFSVAAKKVMPSVVSVDNFQQQTDMFSGQSQMSRTSTASGVILTSDGVIVTNNHVVQGESQVRVRLQDKRVFTAKVLGTDPRVDLAVLKINANNLTPIELGDSTKIAAGQWVIAVGNPLDFDETVSVGVVSNVSRTLPTENGGLIINAIQTDAAINPGNSGGALTDASGRLIGMNSAIFSPTGSSIGIGFAIPVNRVRKVAFDIIKFGHSKEGFLGIAPNPRWDGLLSNSDARQQFAQATGLSNVPSEGIIVPPGSQGQQFGIIAGFPAYKAGIRPYDVLLKIDGVKLVDHYALLKVLDGKQSGDTVSVTYWSKGSVKTVNCVLAGEQDIQNP